MDNDNISTPPMIYYYQAKTITLADEFNYITLSSEWNLSITYP